MSRDLTPTAVVVRPVDISCKQEGFYTKRNRYATFLCKELLKVRAPADCIIAYTDKSTIIVYCELSTITLKITYKGLHGVYAKVGEHLKECEIMGGALDVLKVSAKRVLDSEDVQLEFFYEYDLPRDEETPPDQMA